jgi:transposase-like protein
VKKRCPRCEESLPLDAFAPDRSSADGRFTYCKPCKRAGERERRARPKGRPKDPGPGPGASKPTPAAIPPKRSGPASKLTSQLIAEVCEVLGRGHTRRAAAAWVGLGQSTLRQWLANAQEDGATDLERQLLREVERAEGVGEHTLVELVRDAAAIDPQMAKWLLERRHSMDWARREAVTITTDDKPADVQMLHEIICKRIDAMVAAKAEMPAPPSAEVEPTP